MSNKQQQPTLPTPQEGHSPYSPEQTPPAPESHYQPKQSFHANSNYFTICVYALVSVTIGTIIIYMIVNFSETMAALNRLISALAPFLGAIFIALLLNPLMVFLDQKIFQRLFKGKLRLLCKILSIALSYVVAIGLIAVALIYVLPQVGESIKELAAITPDIVDGITDFLENIEDIYPDLDVAWMEEKIQEIIPNLLSYGTNFITNLVPVLYSVSVSIVRIIVNLLLSIVVSCYMLADKPVLARNCKRIAYALLPEKRVHTYIKTAKECLNIFTGFITGKTLDSLIIGILCFIIMSILRMPYALLISVIVGVTNMIPYFGPFIGAVPGVLIYLFISPLEALGFALMILALQQFDGLILGPKILGSSTGLKPLWVIFAITIGGAYAGVLGMFLGVPVVAVISHLFNKFLKNKLTQKHIPDNF